MLSIQSLDDRRSEL